MDLLVYVKLILYSKEFMYVVSSIWKYSIIRIPLRKLYCRDKNENILRVSECEWNLVFRLFKVKYENHELLCLFIAIF